MLSLFISTTLYPGGSKNNPGSTGFDWEHNYLSNLFYEIAINGADNDGRIWAILGIFILSITFAFLEETALNIKEKNGTLILELKDGESPYGYYYNPDYFYVTEWDSENDFVEFMEKNELLEKNSLKHINQFKLDTNN